LPRIRWLVEELLGVGERLVVYGPVGCFKAWLLLSLGISAATGKPWLGHFAMPKPLRVLYLDMENPEWLIRRRMMRLAEGMGITHENIGGRFTLLSYPKLKFHERDEGGIATLSSEAHGYDLIIVDSLRRVLVGNENNAADVTSFWDRVDELREDDDNRAFVTAHHSRKAGGDPEDRASGSSYVTGGCDVTLDIARAGRDMIVVENPKNRSGPILQPFAVSFYDGGSPDGPVVMKFEGFRGETGARQTKKEMAKARIRAFLKVKGEVDSGAIHAAVIADKAISRRTSEGALSEMTRDGEVVSVAGSCRLSGIPDGDSTRSGT
jgi:hypothetical protein